MQHIRSVRDVGALISDARRERGWTQQQLADAAGVSRHWLGAVERGDRSGAELTLVLHTLATLEVTLVASAPSSAPATTATSVTTAPVVDLDDIISAHTHRR